jgi:hypothetical protein
LKCFLAVPAQAFACVHQFRFARLRQHAAQFWTRH